MQLIQQKFLQMRVMPMMVSADFVHLALELNASQMLVLTFPAAIVI